MLRHTQKIKKIYEEIQKKIYYMIPEKWDKVHLYASIIDRLGKVETGELFFYYIPKGIFKKNPINGYEIPIRFNIDEQSYLKLVDSLYDTIKELRQEFRNSEQKLWSNITISIENVNFKIEYNYDNLQSGEYTSFERHIIWRYKYLGYGMEHCNKEEKEILKKYFAKPEESKNEIYEEGIYIKNIKNIVHYETNDRNKELEEISEFSENQKDIAKNQILNWANMQEHGILDNKEKEDTYIVNRRRR